MREILSGIWTWPWFSEPHGYNFNGHLILHAGGNLCIDPVEPTAADLEEIARLGVSRILLTNRNHSRAANQIRSAPARAPPSIRRMRHMRARKAPSWMMS